MHDLPARLPRSDAELHGVRVHQSLVELARGEGIAGNPRPHTILAAAATDELGLLETQLRRARAGRPVAGQELQTTAALVRGLRLGLAQAALTPAEPVLTWETACSILRAQQASACQSDGG